MKKQKARIYVDRLAVQEFLMTHREGSFDKVSQEIGISASSLWHAEKGRTDMEISIDVAVKIADYYDKPAIYFIRGLKADVNKLAR